MSNTRFKNSQNYSGRLDNLGAQYSAYSSSATALQYQ